MRESSAGESETRRSGGDLRPPRRRGFIVAWVALLAVAVVAGSVTHYRFRQAHINEQRVAILVVAELAANRVEKVITDRISDARLMSENFGYALRVRDFFDDPGDAVNAMAVSSRLLAEHKHRNYAYLQLVASDLTQRMGVPDTATPRAVDTDAVSRALRSPGAVELGDVRVTPEGEVELAVTAPLSAPGVDGLEVIAVCVFHLDMEQTVFTQLERWPGVNQSGEILLVSPAHAGYTILSPRRFGTVEDTGPLLQVASGEGVTGDDFGDRRPFSVRDYRGVEVEAALAPDAGTPWYIQAKLDRSEVYAPVRNHLLTVAASMAAWVVAVSLGMHLLWRSSRHKHEIALATIKHADSKAETLEYLNRELEQANSVKNAFLASMSHELRTPLNAIIGFSGVLKQELAGPLNPEQMKQVEMVHTSGRHLLALIDDVLDIARIEAGGFDVTPERFGLHDAVSGIIEMMAPIAKQKAIELRHVGPTIPIEASTDLGKFRQILLNLVGNAVKFTSEGHVEVRFGGRPYGGIWIEVEDTGPGISAEDLEHIFEPFVQLEQSGEAKAKGTGLGLALSQENAALLGGRITVASQPGKGTVFKLELPSLL